ncbi:MAG: hypothetical protein ACO1RX_20195 [Candidatus Sericytochromatia bacterium]
MDSPHHEIKGIVSELRSIIDDLSLTSSKRRKKKIKELRHKLDELESNLDSYHTHHQQAAVSSYEWTIPLIAETIQLLTFLLNQ